MITKSERAYNLKKQGYTQRQIAQEIGCSEGTAGAFVSAWRKKLKEPPKVFKYQKVAKLFAQGFTRKQIAKKLKMPVESVSSLLVRYAPDLVLANRAKPKSLVAYELHLEGKTVNEIASDLNTPRKQVYGLLTYRKTTLGLHKRTKRVPRAKKPEKALIPFAGKVGVR